MNNFRHRLLTCLAVATATWLPSATHAFYVEARGSDVLVPIRYADMDDPPSGTIDVTYRINESSIPEGVTGGADAIRAAFAAWGDADCSTLQFTEGEVSTSSDRSHWMTDMGEIYILVFFTDSSAIWTGGPVVGNFTFGHDGLGTLIGGTVLLNSRDHMWATDGNPAALDVQSVVTALIGRSLGITSAMEMNATFPRYSPGDDSKRTLGADDLAAIQYLYPSDDATCGTPMDPEAECDGIMMFGEEPCPPRPETMPGDGGTAMPGTDAGPPLTGDDAGGPATGADGGVGSADGGTSPPDSDGCSCRAAGTSDRSPYAGLGLLAALAFGLLARARRRN